MTLMLVDVGANMMLEALFNNVWPAGGKNLTLKLFATDVTPAHDDVVGDYTEAAGGGYVTKTLTNGSWTVNANDPRDATYAQQTWTFTGPLTTNGTIYGYFIVDADGVLVYAEKLGTPFTPAINGDFLKVTPKFQLSHGTPA